MVGESGEIYYLAEGEVGGRGRHVVDGVGHVGHVARHRGRNTTAFALKQTGEQLNSRMAYGKKAGSLLWVELGVVVADVMIVHLWI